MVCLALSVNLRALLYRYMTMRFILRQPSLNYFTFLAIVLAGLPLVQALRLSILCPKSLAILTTRAANTCDDGKDCRTLWQIVRSCLSTLFLCTWLSIHPNIPGPHEHWAKILLRRLGIMSALLIAPELMVSWAVRQKVLARRLAKEHEREWDPAVDWVSNCLLTLLTLDLFRARMDRHARFFCHHGRIYGI
jgi:hypothetical protein